MKKYYYQNGFSFMILDEPLQEIPEGFELVDEDAYNKSQKELQEFLNRKNPIQEKMEEIMRLKGLLASSDYKQHELTDGEITEEEYAPIKAQRHAWRVRIRELRAEIENAQ